MLKDGDVRIIYLPPAAVASVYEKGAEPAPELRTGELIDKFIKDARLETVYPSARHFGFNNPDEPVHGEGHGYERWITIPDNLRVPEPFVKKRFEGGIYAARAIPMGAWDEWAAFHDWVENSEKYDFRWGSIGERLCGWFEEHLNYWNWYAEGLSDEECDGYRQIDLLIPVLRRGE